MMVRFRWTMQLRIAQASMRVDEVREGCLSVLSTAGAACSPPQCATVSRWKSSALEAGLRGSVMRTAHEKVPVFARRRPLALVGAFSISLYDPSVIIVSFASGTGSNFRIYSGMFSVCAASWPARLLVLISILRFCIASAVGVWGVCSIA